VPPGEILTVPQYQKSKGSLIMTAALELSQNQITHFYSPRKDTGEMLRMLAKLIQEYKHKSRIYLSWDAASWHISKMLLGYVDQHNDAIIKGENAGPTVALAPLPSGAQFLNVIEKCLQWDGTRNHRSQQLCLNRRGARRNRPLHSRTERKV
jgi:hypothetical protein